MTVALITSAAAIALMLLGALGIGLETTPGRIVACIGLVLLWVPIRWLISLRQRRTES